MKLIKHLINIMFLWSIPFILLAFFMLITGFSFSYQAAVTSEIWIVIMFFYCALSAILYIVSSGEVDELSIIKTN
jgi:hypothetical protein